MASTPRPGWHDLLRAAHAWKLDPGEIAPDTLRMRCLSWLSSEERTRLEELRSGQQHDYVATRALCRATLSRYAGVAPSEWRFGASAHGKPKIAAPAGFESLRFNLTHTSGLAICLVSRAGEVGVDAEDTSRIVDVAQMASHFVSRREEARLKRLSGAARTERFFELWVLKEAYFKGIGKGIALGPERFTVRFDKDGRVSPIRNWRFFLHRPSSKHVAAAAVRTSIAADPVTVRWMKADGLFGA